MKSTEIKSVTCEIGEVSGVVPEYLTDCWGYARKKSGLLKDSELRTESPPGADSMYVKGHIPQCNILKICPIVAAVRHIFLKETDSALRRLKERKRKKLQK